jgi:predicted nucleotide-binding protein
MPSGKLVSRDMVAIGQGFQSPPHIDVLSEVLANRVPITVSESLSKTARQAAAHLARRERHSRSPQDTGNKVFIGHGRSEAWRDLKDFIHDRLGLLWDEFNRIPVAGITNIARLSQMLDDAGIAFLILTAEDEKADGTIQARMNVIHEAGLFQGRLGFTKAIILLEEGCEEFSNIKGLGQIRFPKGNIKQAFDEIRQVLEREGLLDR